MSVGVTYRERNPAAFERLENAVNRLLTANTELIPFYPAHYREAWDGAVKIANPGTIRTGNVRRVVRPGLKLASGAIRLPAIVEVE